MLISICGGAGASWGHAISAQRDIMERLLIGWDKDVLCFIEVKTRTTHDVKPAQAAVDREKRRAIRVVIRDYLRLLPEQAFPDPPQWRF